MKLKLKKIMMTIASAMTAATMMLATMPAAQVSAATITNDQSKIAMYSREDNWVYHASQQFTNYIRVHKNLSCGKVYLYSKDYNDAWKKEEASFVSSLDDKYDIYAATSGLMGRNPECYAVCEAAGNTYIDNNSGKYYTYQNLGAAPLCVLRNHSYMPDDHYDVNVNLKNIAYQKDVRVRYTLDNWKTFKDAPLSYSMTYTDGTELWGTQIDTNGADKDGFHFAVSYTVNGQTYWDNNFGQNYGA